jgi:glutamate 5-kinase
MQFHPDTLKTLVIKIGTNLLSGRLAFEGKVMEAVVKELCVLKRTYDLNILLVTSGAVGCGMKTLGILQRPTAVPQKQAVAAVGQATLMHYYETLFLTYGEHLNTAQVLLTQRDLDDRRSYLYVRNTLLALFAMKRIIPIINENDSTAVQELSFGDNDTLSAKIAGKINAGLLIILSDIDGLYDSNPSTNKDAKLVPFVERITPDLEACAGGAGTHTATGGMRTKLVAAKIATAAGVPVAIGNGHRSGVIQGILEGTAPCTIFSAGRAAISHRKRWIAFGRAARGSLAIDPGARRALVEQGKSLLAAGITRVEGRFEPGDAVKILDADGNPLAHGLVNYASTDIERIQGKKSGEIAAILGRKDFDEIVHRDNLVLL